MNFILFLLSLFGLIFSEDTDLPYQTNILTPSPPIITPEYSLLKNYQSVRVSADDGMIQFDSSYFDNNEKMYFKIKALNKPGNFYEEKASYEYIISVSNYVKSDMKGVLYSSNIDYET